MQEWTIKTIQKVSLLCYQKFLHRYLIQNTIYFKSNHFSYSAKKNNKMKKLVCLLYLTTYLFYPNTAYSIQSNDTVTELLEYVLLDEKHPCARTCTKNSPPMVCRYTFLLEWYQTMSKACYECPHVKVDCNREHCIPGDGRKRPILVVNRQMPGPSIEVSLWTLIRNCVYAQLVYYTSIVLFWYLTSNEIINIYVVGHWRSFTSRSHRVPILLSPKSSTFSNFIFLKFVNVLYYILEKSLRRDDNIS